MDTELKRKKIEEIEKIVNEVLKNNSDLFDLMDTWPLPKGPFLPNEEELRHVLDHYVADQDIRSKEVQYEEYQREEVLEAYKIFLDSNNG